MLTVVVLSLLYVGSANMYTTEDFEKSIKKIIKDKDREAEVLDGIASFQRAQADMEAELQRKVVAFQLEYDNKTVTKEVMVGFFEDIKVLYTDYYNNGTKDRMAITKLLTQAEWDQLVSKYEKDHGKIVKARSRRFTLLDKELDKIEKAIGETISDAERSSQSVKYIDESQAAFNSFYEASNKINFIDSKVLRSKDSSEEEVRAVYEQWNTERATLYSSVIDESVALSEVYSIEEWNEILDHLKSKF